MQCAGGKKNFFFESCNMQGAKKLFFQAMQCAGSRKNFFFGPCNVQGAKKLFFRASQCAGVEKNFFPGLGNSVDIKKTLRFRKALLLALEKQTEPTTHYPTSGFHVFCVINEIHNLQNK